MNENRMKTPDITGEVSLLAVQEPDRGARTDGERGCGSEKQGFRVEKWLDRPRGWSMIAETVGKA
jgi:hypothetical protein